MDTATVDTLDEIIAELEAENERLRAVLAEIVRMYDDDDDCGDLDAKDLAELARFALSAAEPIKGGPDAGSTTAPGLRQSDIGLHPTRGEQG